MDKPRKKRFVPFGLITAAAVVAVVFIASKGGPLNVFMKAVQPDNANNEGQIADNYGNAMFAAGLPDAGEYFTGSFDEYDAVDDDAEIAAERVTVEGEAEYGLNTDYNDPDAVADGGSGNSPMFMRTEAEDVPEEAAEAAEYEPPAEYAESEEDIQAANSSPVPAAVEASRFEPMEDYLTLNTGLEAGEFYEIYFIGAGAAGRDEIRAKAIKDIEVYKTDPNENIMFDITDKKYKGILDGNMLEYNIIVEEVLIKYRDGNYIAVIYWFN